MLKIYSDNTTTAVVVDESNKSYKQVSCNEARKISKSIQSKTYYKPQIAQLIQDLNSWNYERTT